MGEGVGNRGGRGKGERREGEEEGGERVEGVGRRRWKVPPGSCLHPRYEILDNNLVAR